MRKKTIFILNWKDVNHPHVGGAELIAHYFARNLVRDGHTVTFFCQTFPDAKSNDSIDGVNIVRKGSRITVFYHVWRYYCSLKKKPDIVLEMMNTIGWQTPLYVPDRKRRAYLNQLAREVWQWEFPWPISWLGNIYERLQYFTYRNTRFLCYSNSTKQDLTSYGIPKKYISMFPLGLDHKRYKIGRQKSKDPLFVFVARLVPMKRADLCIRAMKVVCARFPKALLAVVGNGPQEDELKRLAGQLGLQNNVRFVDKNNFHVDKAAGDPKIELMQRAWALLLPSVKEGWGMVVTEAAACGTPAIVSNVSGLRDSVVNNRSGCILSRHPDASELAEAMLRIIDDEPYRTRLSLGARKWSTHFSWDTSYTKFKKALLK